MGAPRGGWEEALGSIKLPLVQQIGPVWQSVGLGEASDPALPELPCVEDVAGLVLVEIPSRSAPF